MGSNAVAPLSAPTAFVPSCSSRHKLHRRVASSRRAKATDVFHRSRRLVLDSIGAVDGVAKTLAACTDGPSSNLPRADLNRSQRIFQERSIPSARFLRPRPGEDTIRDDNSPDPDETMARPGTRPDPQDLALIDRCQDRPREPNRHPRTLTRRCRPSAWAARLYHGSRLASP